MRQGWPYAPNIRWAISFSLDREGFALKSFRNAFDRFDDDDAVRSQFYAPVAEFVRTSVGARRAIVFDHTIRSKVNEQQQTADIDYVRPADQHQSRPAAERKHTQQHRDSLFHRRGSEKHPSQGD